MQLHRNNLLTAILILGCATAQAVYAQDSQVAGVIIEDVRIFNGRATGFRLRRMFSWWATSSRRSPARRLPMSAGMKVLRIRGGGRTLMPGLIDNHWHTMLARPLADGGSRATSATLNLLAGAEAQATLMRGFTTVRDLGGPSFGLKRAIDEGLVVGPRIYPSGAMITITGGHGDFRSPSELPRQLGGPTVAHGDDRRQHGCRFARTKCGSAYASNSCSALRKSS